jgi:hypothetical protein
MQIIRPRTGLGSRWWYYDQKMTLLADVAATVTRRQCIEARLGATRIDDACLSLLLASWMRMLRAVFRSPILPERPHHRPA